MNDKYRTEETRAADLRKLKAMRANAQGRCFEDYIAAACEYYRRTGAAYVDKMPEPFRVLAKSGAGVFTGRFVSNARPDFIGTLDGGRTIIFEAKHTSGKRLKQSVITDMQWRCLEEHWRAGAAAGVCAGIGDMFAFIPWGTWREMDRIYGHRYLTEEDMEMYRIKFDGRALFLDYIHPAEDL